MSFDNRTFSILLKESKPRCSFRQFAVALDRMSQAGVDSDRCKQLELLRDICRLSYYRNGEPYGPFFLPAGVGRRPLEMTQEQYNILSGVVGDISNNRLRARVADLLWLCGKQLLGKSEFKYGKMAIEAFSDIEIDEARWICDGLDKDWRRGLVLSKSLGVAGLHGFKKMQSRLLSAFNVATETKNPQNQLRWAIPKLLEDPKLVGVIEASVLARSLEMLVEDCKREGYEYGVGVHSLDAAKWYRLARDDQAVARMMEENAETRIRTAESEAKQPNPNWLRVGHFYQMAIQMLQAIPKRYRVAQSIDKRFSVLKRLYDDACEKGRKNMHITESSPIDITPVVEWAKRMVQGKEVDEALESFISLYVMKEEDARHLALTFLNSNIVSVLFSKSIIAHGRVVAHAPSWLMDTGEIKNERLWLETVRRASYLLHVACHATLRPAYRVLRDEHKLTKEDFRRVVSAAPMVAEDHRGLFAEALFLGYEGRFTAAVYMLAPEIENAIRNQLKSDGCDTSVTDTQTKLQKETGLSTLIKNHETRLSGMFSPDFLFELKAVFSDHAGPNVRNEVAHGLKNDEDFNGDIDFYVWWFGLKLAFMRPKTVCNGINPNVIADVDGAKE